MKILSLLLLILVFSTVSCGYKNTTPKKKDTRLADQKTLALANYYRKNYPQSLEDLRVAKEIDSKDPEIYNIEGLIYFNLRDYNKAEKSYLKSISLNEEYSEVRFNLCGLYLTMNEWDKAIEQCLLVSSDILYRYRESAFTSLGVAYFRKGDVEKAKASFLEALVFNPAFVYTHNELGKLYMYTGEKKNAMESFLKAIEGYDAYDEAHYNLAQLYLKMGKIPQACAHFQKVVDLSPNRVIGNESKKYLTTICN